MSDRTPQEAEAIELLRGVEQAYDRYMETDELDVLAVAIGQVRAFLSRR